MAANFETPVLLTTLMPLTSQLFIHSSHDETVSLSFCPLIQPPTLKNLLLSFFGLSAVFFLCYPVKDVFFFFQGFSPSTVP